MSPALLGILGYVLIQFAIVVMVVRRARRNSETDYRRFGPGLAMFTIFATWFGAETSIGAAAAIAQHNLIVPLSAGEPT